MPTFDTPESISVTIELGVAGEVLITASDRADTAVEVRPTDENDENDVKVAQQVRVDYANGMLRIVGPKARAFESFSRKMKSVDVVVELPSGSHIAADIQGGNIRGIGKLGASRLKTAAGNVWVERTGPLYLKTSAGHIVADDIDGDAEITTGSGKVQIGEVRGAAVIKNSNGDTTIDGVTGDLRLRSANGDIVVERADANVEVKTANGDIRLGRVVKGSVQMGTAMGSLDVGIADGTAAWLEVNTSFGQVRNHLDNATGPDKADQTVEVRGRTAYGDITIHRA